MAKHAQLLNNSTGTYNVTTPARRLPRPGSETRTILDHIVRQTRVHPEGIEENALYDRFRTPRPLIWPKVKDLIASALVRGPMVAGERRLIATQYAFDKYDDAIRQVAA